MFAMIVGAAMAFIFVGTPLAIIGLFVVSILDRRRSSAGELAKRAASASKTSTGSESGGALGAHARESQPHASRPAATQAHSKAAKHGEPSAEFLDAPRENCACDG